MLIASPNPSIDRVVSLDRFDPGSIHRSSDVRAQIGGGGANAARSLAGIGGVATLVTMLPRQDAELTVRTLEAEGVALAWIPSGGQVRVATILRERRGRMSVINEPGAAIGAREWEAFARLALVRAGRERLILCTGSLPPGAPVDGYARLARQIRQAGAQCVVDAAGPALEAVIESGESLVVPNLAEAEGLLCGRASEPVESEDALERAQDAVSGLLRRGAPAAVVTAGAAGVAFAVQGPHGPSGRVRAPRVPAGSPIGAGDAFAAGLGLRLERGSPLGAAVEFAVEVAADHVDAAGSRQNGLSVAGA